MKLKTKILSLGSANIAVQIIILVVIFVAFSSLGTGFEKIVGKSAENQGLLEEVQKDISQTGGKVNQMVYQMAELNDLIGETNNSMKILERKIIASSESLSRISGDIDDVLDAIEDEALQDILFDMADSVGDLQEIMKREAMVNLQFSVKSMENSTQRVGDQFENINAISGYLEHLKKTGIKITRASTETLSIVQGFESTISGNKRLLSMLIIGFAAVTAVVSFLLARSVSVSLTGAIGMIRDMARGEGDLTRRFDASRTDEVGELSSWFNKFVEKMKSIMGTIRDHSETMATASAGLLSISEEMTEGAKDLSGRAKSVAHASERMNSEMTVIAETSEQASADISMVADSASGIQAALGGVAQGCEQARAISEEASAKVEKTSQRVNLLGEAAVEISHVTEVITEIAEQTNLLSLNATIEAARAGEAGKGFAVVANEIKSLASQTTKATQDVKEKVARIQSSTDGTIGDVTEISRVISDVNEIVATIAETVDQQAAGATEVASGIQHASDGILEVNKRITESSMTSSEITDGISSVDSVAQEMYGQSKRLHEDAGKLSGISSDRTDMIGTFTV